MIKVNGVEKEFPGNLTILEFLKRENYKDSYVAVERNEVILHREDFKTVHIADGDIIEVVSFMGGGRANGIR